MIENVAKLMQQITHGVYVIAVSDGNKKNAFTASWVMQVSFDPLLLAFSINPQHYSYELLQRGGICSINVLEQGQLDVAAHFAQPYSEEKMKLYDWEYDKTQSSILSECLAYFDCNVSDYMAAGDHEIVICRVLKAGFKGKEKPLLYIETANMDDSQKKYK
ncbi:MAG: flavin reductase family protein [Methylococcales bacterium]|nr:flavin reductase family protein [Methylococcales bacterium]